MPVNNFNRDDKKLFVLKETITERAQETKSDRHRQRERERETERESQLGFIDRDVGIPFFFSHRLPGKNKTHTHTTDTNTRA